MNKQYLRFFNISDENYFDVLFDNRLSFIENFNLLDEIDIKNKIIYDMKFKTALRKDVPIKTFQFSPFYPLSIY